MSNIKRINVGERMSQVVIYNGLVFTAGQVASSAPNKDVGEQTKNVLDKINEIILFLVNIFCVFYFQKLSLLIIWTHTFKISNHG